MYMKSTVFAQSLDGIYFLDSSKIRPRSDHERPEEEQRYSSTVSLTLVLYVVGG